MTNVSETGEPAATTVDLAKMGRAGLGGVLMGLANLVPGISGGTMLLASGVYPDFIEGVARFSTLRWRHPSVIALAIVLACALAALILFAGPVRDAVIHHRVAMYSVFIGLTLGGVPIVWILARPFGTTFWLWAGLAFGLMVTMAWVEPAGGGEADVALLFVAGLAGASAMILPGISGGYLLLLLGQYLPILGAIDGLKAALPSLRAGELAPELIAALGVVVPVGLGWACGVVVVSNALRFALQRFRQPTLGTLLGLLVGAVAGLWPFERVGETGERLGRYIPEAPEFLLALALVAAGFALTVLIGRLGGTPRLD